MVSKSRTKTLFGRTHSASAREERRDHGTVSVDTESSDSLQTKQNHFLGRGDPCGFVPLVLSDTAGRFVLGTGRRMGHEHL
jgi:hypothetical protein